MPKNRKSCPSDVSDEGWFFFVASYLALVRADAPQRVHDLRKVFDALSWVVRASSEATEFRVRLEITERAKSTLREELAQERERREQAERRVAELEQQLGPGEDAPQAPETPPEPSEGPPIAPVGHGKGSGGRTGGDGEAAVGGSLVRGMSEPYPLAPSARLDGSIEG
ncbi:MAG: hypothetical protein M3N18_12780 [Actinomycetota bacterium]|nr:hypothetical protein [Actinomycetota bacterium]